MSRLVARPAQRRPLHDYDLILSTATNGKAVKIPLSGRTVEGLRSTLMGGVARRGYRLHSVLRDAALYVWVDTPDNGGRA